MVKAQSPPGVSLRDLKVLRPDKPGLSCRMKGEEQEGVGRNEVDRELY